VRKHGRLENFDLFVLARDGTIVAGLNSHQAVPHPAQFCTWIRAFCILFRRGQGK
jgi:hypothetical protein